MHHFYLTKGSEKCFHVLPHTYSLGIISTSWITLCICYCIGCISTLYPTQFKLRPDLGEDHSRSWHSSYLYFKRAVQPVNFVHFSQVDNITEIFCKPNCQTRFTELEKYYILKEPSGATLNQRSEFFCHCYHKEPQLLVHSVKWSVKVSLFIYLCNNLIFIMYVWT